jgi:hypothetical protein
MKKERISKRTDPVFEDRYTLRQFAQMENLSVESLYTLRNKQKHKYPPFTKIGKYLVVFKSTYTEWKKGIEKKQMEELKINSLN